MPVHYGRASGSVWRYGHGGVLVLPSPDSEVVALSGTAEDLWQLLVDPVTVDEAARLLADFYDEIPAEIAKEISLVLDDLVARRVLDRITAP